MGGKDVKSRYVEYFMPLFTISVHSRQSQPTAGTTARCKASAHTAPRLPAGTGLVSAAVKPAFLTSQQQAVFGAQVVFKISSTISTKSYSRFLLNYPSGKRAVGCRRDRLLSAAEVCLEERLREQISTGPVCSCATRCTAQPNVFISSLLWLYTKQGINFTRRESI